MAKEFKAESWLRSLDNFSDPTGPAARLQTERLMKEARQLAATDPERKFRLTADGPEQTISEIIAELDAEEAAIAALKQAVEGRSTKGGDCE